MEKIYFPAGSQATNIYELIALLFMAPVGSTQMKAVETFSDPEFTIRQCKVANRSFGDLLCLCNTYFPGTTEKQLIDTLDAQFRSTEPYALRGFICFDIGRVVFYKMVRFNSGDTLVIEADSEEEEERVEDQYTTEYLIDLLSSK